MGVLDKAKKKIATLENKDVRERYMDALDLSIDGDYANLKSVCSAKMIEEQFSLELDVQLKYYISLDKHKAVELLTENGKEITLAVLRKKFSKIAYEKKFRRKISVIGTKQIFTYSEVMVLANHLVPLK